MKKLLLLIFFVSVCSNSFAQKIIKLTEGKDVISAAYDSAQAGDIIELVTSGGTYEETSDFVVAKDKPVTIRAAEGLDDKPRWYSTAGWCLIILADNLTLDGIVLDGVLGTGTREAIIRGAEPEWHEIKTDANLKISNCEFINAGYGIYGEDQNRLDTVLVSGCLFKNLGQSAINFIKGSVVPGQVNHFICENSTFWNIKNYAIYIVSNSVTANPQIDFQVNHITVHDAGNINIYPGSIDSAVIKNSIFSSSSSSAYKAFTLYGTNSKAGNVLYYNLDGIGFESGATEQQLFNIQANIDPLFASVSGGNFTLMSGSPAINAGDDGKSLGDSRWWPENNKDYAFITEGENKISEALASAIKGQTIVLTSDGGIYNESSTMVIDKKINIVAADGMNNKPVIQSGSADAVFELSDDFLLRGVILDGSKGSAKTAIGITNKPDTHTGKLTVQKTDFLNFVNEGGSTGFGIYGNSNSVIDSVFIQNCLFAHIQDMGISFNDPAADSGSVNSFIVDNSTFWDIKAEAIYVDGHDSKVSTKDPSFNVSNLTVYNCGSYNIMPHYMDNAIIKNSIVVSSEPGSNVPVKIYGTNSKVEDFLYYNTTDIQLSSGANEFQLINILAQVNPLFNNPENGDFSFPVSSPAVVMKGSEEAVLLGDSRWWPNLTFPSNIHWGTTHNSLSGLTITWDNQTQDDSIRWGYTKKMEIGTFPAERTDNYQVTSNPEYLFNYTFPDVTPSSTIYYSIKFNGLWSKVRTFVTSVDTASSKFTFIVGADQQVGKEKWQKLSDMALKESADFCLMVGDIVDNSEYPSEWEEYYDYGKNFLEKTLCYYTHGNHVYYDAASGQITLNQLVLPENEKWYSFKQGNTLFVCLLSEPGTLSPQWTYLEDVLKNSDATWKVVFYHRPFFTSDDHAGEMDTAIPYWWKAFDDYGVNVILNGHSHTYTRSKPINLNLSDSTGVVEYGSRSNQGRLQMLAGSFGASTYSEQEGWWVEKTKSSYNYVRFQVDGDKMHFDAIDEEGIVIDSLTLYPQGVTTDVTPEGDSRPTSYQIYQNYPNPFNPTTKISYCLPVTGKVVLKVYDMLGREVETLVNEEKQAGVYTQEFNASSLASGVYFYKIQAGSFSDTHKMILLK